MNPIKHSDIVQDDGAIKEAIALLKLLKIEKDRLFQAVAALEVETKKLNVTRSEDRAQIEKNATKTEQLTQKLKTYKNTVKELTPEIARLRAERKQANLLTRNEVKLADNAATSYNALSAQYSINKARLNAMTRAQREGTAAGRKLESTTREIYEEMKRLQSVTGKNTLDVGNYSTAVKGLYRSLKNLLTVYFSLSGVQRFIESVFTNTKALDALRVAYSKVIPDAVELDRVNDFLAKTADDLGLNILDLSDAYLKLRAAAKTSNLTTAQTDKIFKSFAKTSAVLGKSQADNRLIFLALEQMISKGKISSEELRQQLGERIPGAMAIMAKATGVTVSKLGDMLKRGEVLSDVALPAFAEEMEKAFGIENTEIVDSLTAAQNRFSSEFIGLVERMKAADVFKDFFNTMADGIRIVKENIGTIVNVSKAVGLAVVAFTTWKLSILATVAAQRIGLGLLFKDIAAKGLYSAATLSASRATAALNLAVRANPFGILATIIVTAVTALTLFNNEAKESLNVLQTVSDTAKKNIISEKVEAKLLIDVLKEETATREAKQDALIKLNQISPQYFGNLDLEKLKVNDLTQAYDDYSKSLLKSARVDVAKDQIKEITRELQDEKKLVEESKLSLLEEFSFPFQRGETVNTVNAERLADYKKSLNDQLDELSKFITKENILFSGSSGSGGKNEETEAEKKKRLALIERKNNARLRGLAFIGKAQKESLQKELSTLEINFEKRKLEWEKYGLDIAKLTEAYNLRRQGITDKFAKKDREKLSKQLDKEIKFIDEQIKIDLKKSKNQNLTTKERIKLTESAANLNEEIIKKESDFLTQISGQKINLNSIISESDALKAINTITALKLEEDAQNKIIEVIRRRKNVNQNIAQAELKIESDRAKRADDDFKRIQKENAEKLEKGRAAALKNLDELQAFKKSEFDLIKSTEAEKERFRLNAEKEKLKKLLEINRQFGNALSAEQIKTIQNTIEKINQELGNIKETSTGSLWDKLGLNIKDDQKEALVTAFDFAKSQLSEYQAQRVEVAGENVQITNTAVSESQRELNAQIANRNAGFAHSVATAQAELNEAKKNQKAALDEQQKAKKAQERIQSIQQAANLVTATSKIWGTLGFPAAIPATAIMWGSFIAAKARAKKLTRFGKGTFEKVGYGGSHASGNDIPFGEMADGSERRIERNESVAVFTKAATAKYSFLPQLIKAINTGKLSKTFNGASQTAASLPVFNMTTNTINTSKMEGYLSNIEKQGQWRTYTNERGQMVEQKGDFRRTYVN